MIVRVLALVLLLMVGPLSAMPVDVVVVSLPVKGSVSVTLNPSGKADIERNGTVSAIHIEIDKVQTAQKLASQMNAYVVWAISPEGGYENVGELGITDSKGRLDTTTRFDQFGILITAEPYFLVDRPNSVVAFRSQAPKSDAVRRIPVSIEIGSYDYSKLQPVISGAPGLVAQARAALQVATGVQAERYAESEYRLASIALGTMEEMLGRSTPMESVLTVANETIRRSQKSFVAARDNLAASALDSSRSDAALLKRDVQQLQDRMQQLTNEHAATLDQVRRLDAAAAASARDKQQVTGERDAALLRIRSLESDISDVRSRQEELKNAPALRLPAEYFDVAAGMVSPAGTDPLTKIAAAVAFWSDPVRIACPKTAMEILKRFFAEAGVAPNRVVIVADR